MNTRDIRIIFFHFKLSCFTSNAVINITNVVYEDISIQKSVIPRWFP